MPRQSESIPEPTVREVGLMISIGASFAIAPRPGVGIIGHVKTRCFPSRIGLLAAVISWHSVFAGELPFQHYFVARELPITEKGLGDYGLTALAGTPFGQTRWDLGPATTSGRSFLSVFTGPLSFLELPRDQCYSRRSLRACKISAIVAQACRPLAGGGLRCLQKGRPVKATGYKFHPH